MLNSIQNILLINTSNGLDNRLCLFKSSFESVTDVLTYLFMVSSHSGPIQSNLKLFRSQFNQDTDNSIPSHSDPININKEFEFV